MYKRKRSITEWAEMMRASLNCLTTPQAKVQIKIHYNNVVGQFYLIISKGKKMINDNLILKLS